MVNSWARTHETPPPEAPWTGHQSDETGGVWDGCGSKHWGASSEFQQSDGWLSQFASPNGGRTRRLPTDLRAIGNAGRGSDPEVVGAEVGFVVGGDHSAWGDDLIHSVEVGLGEGQVCGVQVVF